MKITKFVGIVFGTILLMATIAYADNGKCGAGKCGGDMGSKKMEKKMDGKCGGDKGTKKMDGKCGAGKCGGDKSSKKMKGKCGAGKCGS